ncbi:MAG: hypothetical protein ACJ77R_04740 [Gemmatimonadaceae bacterium]
MALTPRSWNSQRERSVHSEQDLFAIVPGQDIPDLETVVASNDGYAIVRKHMEKLAELKPSTN